MLEEIFRRIGIVSKTAIEIGAGQGTENNTMYLLFQDWKCFWIECNTQSTKRMQQTHQQWLQSNALTVETAFVTDQNVVDIIEKFARQYGDKLDLMTVDIDSQDYWVLQAALKVAQPRVICAEYNGLFPASVSVTVPRGDKTPTRAFYGASLAAITKLVENNYALVGCTPNGVNAFFVRRDLELESFAAPFTAENHFEPWAFQPVPHERVDWVVI